MQFKYNRIDIVQNKLDDKKYKLNENENATKGSLGQILQNKENMLKYGDKHDKIGIAQARR